MRPFLPLIIVGLVLASAAFLVQPASAQVPSTSTYAGQVCIQPTWAGSDDVECYDPLPDAKVHLQGGGLAGVGGVNESTTSDADGAFSFDDVPDGDYTLTIQRKGFSSLEEDVSLPADHTVFNLRGKQVTATGVVVDADGAGIADARVSMWGDEGSAYAATDNDGAFEVSLTAGMYEVEVEAKYFGFSGERRLVDGSDLRFELGSLPGQDALLRGQVVDQDGTPVADADVIVEQWEAYEGKEYRYGDFRNGTQTDADGRYAIDVYAGGLSLQIRKPGHAEVYDWMDIAQGETRTRDAELLAYPEKTARIEGKIVDADGDALRHVSINMEHPEYGLYTCSQGGSRGGHDHVEPEPMPAYEEDVAYGHYAYEPEPCDITLHDDGTFTGNVTPGYAILNVWYDRWAACDETHHADGGYSRDCGPDYFSYTQSLTLPADDSTQITIELRQRPGADAAASGYVVDGETQTAIPDAWISFNNQETYAHGSASTDDDGSYKVRLRSGYHQVSVWAEGYLPWQGVVEVPADGEMPFDVVLTPGEARYGGCCYAHAEPAVAYDEGHSDSGPDSASGSMRASDGEAASAGGTAVEAPGGSSSGGDGEAFEDLGGGLGPYDPQARQAMLEKQSDGDAKGIPNPLPAVLVGLVAVALLRRR